jgi:hypothetical protein
MPLWQARRVWSWLRRSCSSATLESERHSCKSDPRIGLELPLRMLVWEDPDGALLGYNDPFERAV